MKKVLLHILAFMALSIPMFAQDPDNKPSTIPIILESLPIKQIPNPKPHRTPMRICVEAYYDALAGTISIIYDGEKEGEVNLYRDAALVDSSSQINTTFFISDSGLYTIEINAESWTATGSIEIQ